MRFIILFKEAAPYCQSQAQAVTRSAEEEPQDWTSVFSPQGGESGGWVGMCLARHQTHRPASQISLPVGLWERGCIIKSPGMGWGLMRWMTGS